MFSVPAIYARTANERNTKRLAALDERFARAENELEVALARLKTQREGFQNVTPDMLAALDMGQCQNLANSAGHAAADIARPVTHDLVETLFEISVIGSGFEVASDDSL